MNIDMERVDKRLIITKKEKKRRDRNR